jgi:hypothetical protein
MNDYLKISIECYAHISKTLNERYQFSESKKINF